MLLAVLTLSLASNTFQPMNVMPPSTSCYISGHPPYIEANAVSPELHWSGASPQTQSYALVMIDRDYRARLHWLVYDIPATTQSLPAGVVLAPPYRTGPMGTAAFRYMGACPPHGQTHHYVFSLYALDVAKLRGWPGNTMMLMRAMSGHILNRAYLTGVFQAP